MFVKGVMLCELGLLRSAIQLFWGKEKMKAVQLLKKLCRSQNTRWYIDQCCRKISEALKELCDSRQLDLIVTTGGTGLSPSDQTPEATMDILERIVPGISEALRWNSMRFTPRAMLSRGVAGIRKNTLVINLPGSPQAVEECLRFLLPALSHGLEVLKGNVKDCAKDR